MALIELKQIGKDYDSGELKVTALEGIDLSIQSGEYISILGPSGSGKSTLMNILGCLDRPSRGQYWIDKQDISTLSRNQLATIRNHRIGFVFQSFNLLDYASALDNVALPLIYAGIKRHERGKRASELLKRVGLGDRMHHKPNQLSGGQKQRVAIARALANHPHMVLADEPTGALDSQSGAEIETLFNELNAEGATFVIVTHDLELAERTQRVIQIRDGRIEADRTI